MILDKRANEVSLTNGTETGHRKKRRRKMNLTLYKNHLKTNHRLKVKHKTIKLQ